MRNRQKTSTLQTLAICTFVSSVLIACSGGGGSSSNSDTSATSTITGTAASGRPYPVGTQITVIDATGATVGSTTISSNDGTYSLALASTAKAPLVITATADDEETLVSIKASTTSGNVNITPQTHLIAAGLSPSGDPTQLAAEIKAGTATVTQTNVDAKVSEVQTLLGTVSSALNDNSNPLTASFKADGTGLDRVLESVKISVLPQGNGTSQIQVAVKADDPTIATPISITTSVGATTKLDSTPLPTVTQAALPQAGLITQVNDLLKRMETCYNQTKATRVSSGTGPSAIASSECKSIFLNNDPSSYKNNSYTVGNGTGTATAWSTLYSNADSTKLAWDQGAVQFTIQNPAIGQMAGDVVFTSRWTATFPCVNDTTQTCSNTAVDTYVARADSSGKLYQVGNQSNYDLSVDPRVEYRDLPNLKDSSGNTYSYLNVGYNLYVKNSSSIGKVVVTSPKGNKLLLKPIAGGGYSYLGLTKSDGTVTTTSVVRMSAAYVNSTVTSSSGTTGTTNASTNHPRDVDPALFWSADLNHDTNAFIRWKNWTDAELAAIPDQSVWTFDIYDTSNNKVATEKRRTISRAPTMAEAKRIIWPDLVTDARTALINLTESNGGFSLSSAKPVYVTSDGTATGGAAWTVPAGAWAPLSIKVYGSYKTPAGTFVSGFDDSVDVRSSWRKATIFCSGSDGHCQDTTAGTYKPYSTTANYAAFWQLQFNGRDARRVQNTRSIHLKNRV